MPSLRLNMILDSLTTFLSVVFSFDSLTDTPLNKLVKSFLKAVKNSIKLVEESSLNFDTS